MQWILIFQIWRNFDAVGTTLLFMQMSLISIITVAVVSVVNWDYLINGSVKYEMLENRLRNVDVNGTKHKLSKAVKEKLFLIELVENNKKSSEHHSVVVANINMTNIWLKTFISTIRVFFDFFTAVCHSSFYEQYFHLWICVHYGICGIMEFYMLAGAKCEKILFISCKHIK